MIRSIKASTSLLRATTIISRPTLPSLQLNRQSTPLNYYFSSTSTSFNAPAISSSSSTSDLPPLRVESIVIPPTTQATKKEKVSRIIKARKAAITLTPTALTHIAALLLSPTPRLIRIGVRNKGCAGMSYHLDYVVAPEKFDEIVEQDGVKVVVDSKALFSVIGSEMDWQEDALGAKFVFKNPNSVDTCGCGESFTV